MSPLRGIAAAVLGFTLIPSILADVATDFAYNAQKVRGVNLGGWLVLEPWITPSLFDDTCDTRIIDEWTFGQYQDLEEAKATLVNHWDTWITETDLRDIAAAGLNHVRIPIGYWAFETAPGEPFIPGQLPYLYKAIDWAAAYGLKVIIDLHGAPGSQNGFDNSGQKMDRPRWHTNRSNVERTNAVIKRIADMFKDNPTVVPIIAPLNEPAGFYDDAIKTVTRNYWRDSYQSIRFPYADNTSRKSNTIVMIHDAFQPPSYWGDFMTNGFENVMMDTHVYQMFSIPENQRSEAEHIANACQKGSTLKEYQLPVVVGEWTAAANDCAKYLNGRGIGSRYDGTFPGSESSRVGSCDGYTGKASTFSESYKKFLGQYWEAQSSTYEKSGRGWIQWTWKAEIADEWTYQAGLEYGWIPKNPTARAYPNICN